MIFEAAGRLGICGESLFSLTWRELDDMDHGRKLLSWDLVCDLKSFMASCNGVTIAADDLNPIRQMMGGRQTGEKRKPSEVSPDGNVKRRTKNERRE